MRQFFTIKVKTINQVVQENQPSLNFNCDQVVPLGPGLVREIDSANECIKVVKVFMFQQNGDLFGTSVVKDSEGWRQYINANCRCCAGKEGCDLHFNGCTVTINGCQITVPCSLCN